MDTFPIPSVTDNFCWEYVSLFCATNYFHCKSIPRSKSSLLQIISLAEYFLFEALPFIYFLKYHFLSHFIFFSRVFSYQNIIFSQIITYNINLLTALMFRCYIEFFLSACFPRNIFFLQSLFLSGCSSLHGTPSCIVLYFWVITSPIPFKYVSWNIFFLVSFFVFLFRDFPLRIFSHSDFPPSEYYPKYMMYTHLH